MQFKNPFISWLMATVVVGKSSQLYPKRIYYLISKTNMHVVSLRTLLRIKYRAVSLTQNRMSLVVNTAVFGLTIKLATEDTRKGSIPICEGFRYAT